MHAEGFAASGIRMRARRLTRSIRLLALIGFGGITWAASPLAAQAPAPGTIVGQVVSAVTGEGVRGAEIMVLGTTRTAFSATDGAYRVSGLAPGSYEVRARAIGFEEAVHRIEVQANQTVALPFRLTPSPLPLEEIEAIGVRGGVAQHRLGAVTAVIRPAEVPPVGVHTLSELLQARLPGLQVTPQGGKPGQGSRILSRGVRGMSGRTTPLVIVDGVRIHNSPETGLRRGVDGDYDFGGEAWSGLDDISIDDIDRIEVLPGPAAAALYGSEGANGVLNIVTKRGVGDRHEVRVRGGYGFANAPAAWWSASPHGEWYYDEFVRSGMESSAYLSVRGGVDRFQYYAGATVRSAKGVLPQTGQDYWSVRANMRAEPMQAVAIEIFTGFSNREIDLPYDAGSLWGLTRNALIGGDSGLTVTPAEILTYDVGLLSRRFTAGMRLENSLFRGFTHSLTLGSDIFDCDNTDFNPFGTNVREGGKKINYRRDVTLLSLDYRANYTRAFGSVKATTTVGAQGMRRDQAYTLALGYNFAGPGLSVVEVAGVTDGDQNREAERMMGGYVQETINLRDRLFVTAGVRVDGYSNHGRSARYQTYPLFNASWVLPRMDRLRGVDAVRLRGAYGVAGQTPDVYLTERTWNVVDSVHNGSPGLLTGKVGAPDLAPERVRELEGGLDMSLFGERLTLGVTYYDQRTEDALVLLQAAPSLGFPEPQVMNGGETGNRGIELTAHARILAGTAVRWNVHGGLFTNRQRVTSIARGKPVHLGGAQWIREGHPVGGFFADNGDYIGPAFPVRTIQFGSDLQLGERIGLVALFDHAGGHFLQSNTLIDLMQAGDPISNPVNDLRDFVFPADYWRLRELSLSYQLPPGALRILGLRAGRLAIGGRNLWRSQEYDGLEAEAYSDPKQPLLNQTWFNTPLPRQVVLGIEATF